MQRPPPQKQGQIIVSMKYCDFEKSSGPSSARRVEATVVGPCWMRSSFVFSLGKITDVEFQPPVRRQAACFIDGGSIEVNVGMARQAADACDVQR